MRPALRHRALSERNRSECVRPERSRTPPRRPDASASDHGRSAFRTRLALVASGTRSTALFERSGSGGCKPATASSRGCDRLSREGLRSARHGLDRDRASWIAQATNFMVARQCPRGHREVKSPRHQERRRSESSSPRQEVEKPACSWAHGPPRSKRWCQRRCLWAFGPGTWMPQCRRAPPPGGGRDRGAQQSFGARRVCFPESRSARRGLRDSDRPTRRSTTAREGGHGCPRGQQRRSLAGVR